MLIRTSLTLMILISPFSVAQTLQDKLLSCAQNNDSLQRLVCYDKLSKNLKVKDVQEVQEVQAQPIKPQQSNNMGVKKPAEPKKVAMPVAAKTMPMEPSKPAAIKKPKGQEADAQAKFGHEGKQPPEELLEQIQAKVSKISKSVYGQYTITLENQQVWRQTDKTRLKITQGQMVSIERGVLGSFFMSTEKVNKRIRVKRVK